MYKRFTKNALVNIANMGVNSIVYLLLTPVFINALGAEIYGIWVFVVSLSVGSGLLGFFNLGIQGAVIKYIAEYDALGNLQAEREVASAALLVYTLIGLLLGGLLVSLATFGQGLLLTTFNIPIHLLPTVKLLLLLLAMQTCMDFPGLMLRGVLDGWQYFDVTRGFNIVRLLVLSIGSIVFLHFGFGVLALALATFVSEMVRHAGHLYWMHRLRPDFRLTRHITLPVVREIFSMSGYLLFFSVLTTIYEQMDKIIIAVFLTTTFLTDYDISLRLHMFVLALTTILSSFVVPLASALHAQQKLDEVRLLLLRATRYSIALTVPVAMIIIVIARPLTIFWVGANYAHTALSTQLFVGYILIFVVMRVGMNMLVAIKRFKKLILTNTVTTVINLAVSITLVQSLGVRGVIWGTVIGNSVAIVPVLLVFRQEFRIGWRDIWLHLIVPVYPYAIAGAITTALLLQWRYAQNIIELGIYSALGLMVFLGLFFLFGMPAEEKTALLGYLPKSISRHNQ